SSDLGRITLFNRGAERMLGYGEPEMLGKEPTRLHLQTELDQRAAELSEQLGRPIVGHEIFTALPQRDGSETRLWTVMRSDGRPLIVSLSISGVRSRDGELLGFLGVARDISAQMRAEAELREANAMLETRVGLRTAELSAALSHLRQAQEELLRSEKMAALGSLVAGVAHELNTPLGNCLTTASTLDERTQETLQAFAADRLRRSGLADYLRDAAAGANILLRGLSTANELVAHFKQLSVDQTSSQRRQFDLASTIDDVLSLLRPRLRNTPYKLDCQISVRRPLDSYPGPLGQVVTNLVLNALLHAFDGREQGRILISATELDAQRLQLIIEDDGVGMSAEVRRRAFDPFFTTKMGSGGTGLGLNIVYNIVRGVLGGQIELISEPGRGARFLMRLPFAAPQLPRSGGHSPSPAMPAARP
ncbi:MAG: PAS domain-containing sensor histidine kinase, partial [Burkholderiaceae bacterium]